MTPVLVTDLKQWAYCERIVYYRQLMPGAGKATFKMEEGKAAQDMVESMEMRRTLGEYGLTDARRRFGVWLEDSELGLAGKADLVLEDGATANVVEFKLTSGEPGENHLMQIAGYAHLLMAAGFTLGKCFWYRIPDSRVYEVDLPRDWRERVRGAVNAIRLMVESEICPGPTAATARCVECEYANLCGDTW